MSIEKIEQELRDGLNGVTPGSWSTRPTAEGMADTFITAPAENKLGYRVIAIVSPQKKDADAAHIARCSPENIRALLDELFRLREAIEEFGTSRVRDRVAARVGCNHDILHDALQSEVRRALSDRMEGQE